MENNSELNLPPQNPDQGSPAKSLTAVTESPSGQKGLLSRLASMFRFGRAKQDEHAMPLVAPELSASTIAPNLDSGTNITDGAPGMQAGRVAASDTITQEAVASEVERQLNTAQEIQKAEITNPVNSIVPSVGPMKQQENSPTPPADNSKNAA